LYKLCYFPFIFTLSTLKGAPAYCRRGGTLGAESDDGSNINLTW
jgi:hypothetical protein